MIREDPNCYADDRNGCLNFARDAFKSALLLLGVYNNQGNSNINSKSNNMNNVASSVWEWGDVHNAEVLHPIFGNTEYGCLWDRKVRRGGDGFTPNVGGWKFSDVGGVPSFKMTSGSSYRQVQSFVCCIC